MKFEKQIDDAHCIPACLKMILGDDCPFTQEEIGFMCKTTRNGTYVEDTVPFLEMLGYKLVEYKKAKTIPRVRIMDGFDGEDDHWSLIMNVKQGYAIFNPYCGFKLNVFPEKIYEIYVLERI